MNIASMPTVAVVIDPRNVPDEEYQTACSVLASSIRLSLADPALRKEYEDWKAAREGQ